MPAARHATLHIVEPNLVGHSGHYAEFVAALAARSAGVFDRIEVHAGVEAREVLAGDARVRMHAVFGARGRHRQEAQVLAAGLATGDPVLVLTAHAAHAPLLSWLSRRAPPGSLANVRLYFHWRERGLLDRAMMSAAHGVRRQAVAIAPTEPTADYLRSQGWSRVLHVAYPMLAPAVVPPAQPFRHLLVAGAARLNKGLDLVVGLAERMAAAGDATPLIVQTTPKRRSGRRGSREELLVARLRASGATGLQASDEAPASREYGARFEGALVLAPYDPEHFADNVSGVVLDALLRGAPVVASAGSFPGRMVERFGAGEVLRERSPQALAAAIDRVRRDWPAACERAQAAARTLAAEHDPAQLVRALREGA